MNLPKKIMVQTTTRCNARCVFCPHPTTYARQPEKSMPDEIWYRLITDCEGTHYVGSIELVLHMEPLIDPKVVQRVRDIRSIGAYSVIATNASLLYPDLAIQLATARPYAIHCNVPSPLYWRYNKATGLDGRITFVNIQNLLKVRRPGTHIVINVPLSRNKSQHVSKERYENLFPGAHINMFRTVSRGGLRPSHASKTGNTCFIRDELKYCFQPSEHLPILCDGSLLACCIDWMHESLGDWGNIMEENTFDLFSRMLTLQQEFKEGDYSRYTMCRYCATELGWPQKKEASDESRRS